MTTTHDFTRWLEEQRRRPDPVGDLARDVAGDEEWPGREIDADPDGRGLEIAEAHVEDLGGDEAAIDALHRAFREWSQDRGPRVASFEEIDPVDPEDGLRRLAVLADRVVRKALRDEVAPSRSPSSVWRLDDGGYPAELSALADELDELRRHGLGTDGEELLPEESR